MKNRNWVQVYRPNRLDDMALDANIRALFAGYIEQGEIPNLLLYGPPGCGKTTVAKVLGRRLDCGWKEYAPDVPRGVERFREMGEVRMLLKTHAYPRRAWTIISLPEAEQLSPETQQALRPLMEEPYSRRSRFILSTNDVEGIDAAVRQRCVEVKMDSPPWDETLRVLTQILADEGLSDTPDDILLEYVKLYPHPRRLISQVESSLIRNGGTLPMPEGS